MIEIRLHVRRAWLIPSLRAALVEAASPVRRQKNKPEPDFDPLFGVALRAKPFRLGRCELANRSTTPGQLAVVSGCGEGWIKQQLSTHHLEVKSQSGENESISGLPGEQSPVVPFG
jgi:hypothetical protein